MSSGIFILPPMFQTLPSELKESSSISPEGVNSLSTDKASSEGQDFLTALKQITAKQCSRQAELSMVAPETACTHKWISNFDNTAGLNADLGSAPEGGEDDLTLSTEIVPFERPSQAFDSVGTCPWARAMIDEPIFYLGDNKNLEEEINTANLKNYLEILQFKRQGPPSHWLPSITSFESLPADITSVPTNSYYFDQLMPKPGYNLDSETKEGIQFFKFWHWIARQSLGNSVVPQERQGTIAEPTVPDRLLASAVDSLPLDSKSLTINSHGQNGGMAKAINGNEDQFASMGSTYQTDSTDIIPKGSALKKDAHLGILAQNEQRPGTQIDVQKFSEPIHSERFKFQAKTHTDGNPATTSRSAEGVITLPAEDSLSLKSAVPKNYVPLAAETGNKVVQVEADNKDNGFMYAHEKSPERVIKSETEPRAPESTPRHLLSQTLNQIVHKAVLSIKDKLNEVKIDLKPEFLGHIRMQIITENQQVAVKIAAELPFVRSMLESNLSQLKADLQAQGLEIDELEVSVANDSDQPEYKNKKAAEITMLQTSESKDISSEALIEENTQSKHLTDETITATSIDYFA
jgi:hypothetical protein